MAFEQAEIRVEKEKEFRELKRAIEEALSPENIKRFLKGRRRFESETALPITKPV